MRKSSYVILGLILMVFVGIQGWVISKTFFAPRTFAAVDAMLMGETVEIRSPVQVMVGEVFVHESQSVTEGQPLFLLQRLPTDPTAFGQPAEITITAPRSGIFNDLTATRGQLIQADQLLGRILDGGPDALHIQAHLRVEPADIEALQPLMPATIQAAFLNGGARMDAVVTSIDPRYDVRDGTVTLRLRLLTIPADLPRSLGLPVAVVVREDRTAHAKSVESATQP